jgi:hypothetical protein
MRACGGLNAHESKGITRKSQGAPIRKPQNCNYIVRASSFE